MKTNPIEVTIGRKALEVPMAGDEATTRRIAEQVNARMDAIEAREGRVDSYEAALRAAMAYAVELDQTRRTLTQERDAHQRERDQETREFRKALATIANRLRNLVDKARSTPSPT